MDLIRKDNGSWELRWQPRAGNQSFCLWAWVYHIAPRLGDLGVRELSPRRITRFRDELERADQSGEATTGQQTYANPPPIPARRSRTPGRATAVELHHASGRAGVLLATIGKHCGTATIYKDYAGIVEHWDGVQQAPEAQFWAARESGGR